MCRETSPVRSRRPAFHSRSSRPKSVRTSAEPYREPSSFFSELNSSPALNDTMSVRLPAPTTTVVPPRRVASQACPDGGRPPDDLEHVVKAGAAVGQAGHRVAQGVVADLVRRAELRGHLQLAVHPVDGHDGRRPGQPGALDDVDADPAAADHRDGRAGRDLRGVDGRADAGHDPAADQGGHVERDVGVDGHHGVARYHGLLAEGADAQPQGDRPLRPAQRGDLPGAGQARHRAQLRLAAQAQRARPHGGIQTRMT